MRLLTVVEQKILTPVISTQWALIDVLDPDFIRETNAFIMKYTHDMEKNGVRLSDDEQEKVIGRKKFNDIGA